MIRLTCPHCGVKLNLQDKCAGRRGACPRCKQTIDVPKEQPAPVAPIGGRIEGPQSSLSKAGVDVGVTLVYEKPKADADSSGTKRANQLALRTTDGNDRYLVEGEIARGGMGAVLRAIDRDIRREVAVKYLLNQADNAKVARFVEEAQITGQLEHPNIVPIHDLGIDAQKRFFFAMKMVHGRSLAEVLDDLRAHTPRAEREYSLTRLLNILVNVCHALAYAHARNVIHRDLKPANIMIGDFGEVYVMDWGLAKVLGNQPDSPAADSASVIAAVATPSGTPALSAVGEPATGHSNAQTKMSDRVVTSRQAEADLTHDGEIMGTPIYMSPEQTMGIVRDIDHLSDIYSLGAILYEILTLLPPVEKDGDYVAVMIHVAEGQILAPEKRTPQRVKAGKIPRELSAIAMKALAKNKLDRYASAEDLRRDIELYLEGRSVSAKEDTAWESLVKVVKRNRGASIATAIGSILLLVLGTVSLIVNYAARKRAEENYVQAQQNYATAQKNYADYVHEQDERRKQAKISVPAFVAAARHSVDQKEFDVAWSQLNVAMDFDPTYAKGRLLKGQMLVGRREFAAAHDELTEYLKLEPGDESVLQLAKLCNAEHTDDPLTLNRMVDLLFQQDVSPLAELLVKDNRQLVELYRKRIEAVWPKAKFSVSIDGKLSLDLSAQKAIVNIETLRGIPLNSLILHESQVIDLKPLENMPLTKLTMFNCPSVRDFSPLREMQLVELSLHSCRGVASIETLRGLPLGELDLSFTSVDDLSSLIGMPLKTLRLGNCRNMRDFRPLEHLQLTSLTLSGCPYFNDFDVLKKLPVEYLDVSMSNADSLEFVRPLPLTSLNISNTTIRDLTPLRGKGIISLYMLALHNLKDLSPLDGMPLENLDIRSTAVRDLSPLRNSPLKRLSMELCEQIDDLTPLAKLPLSEITMYGCRQVRDVSPLRSVPLRVVRFSVRNITNGMEALRENPTLYRISGQPGILLSAKEFWQRYDAGEYKP